MVTSTDQYFVRQNRRMDYARENHAFVVRRLHLDDFDRGFLETLASLRPSTMSKETFAQIFLSLGEHTRVWVLETGGIVAATCTLLIERKFLHGGGVVGHIEDVAVGAPWKGQGLGKHLLTWVIADARELGCYKLILDCAESVSGFYETLGFRRHEVEMRMNLL